MDRDGNTLGEGWFYAPAPPDTRTYTDLGELTVDGETFAVRRRDDGTLLYDWVSGPNEGYGFNTFGAGDSYSNDEHVAVIRDFLDGIDPATGFLGDP